MVAISFVLAGVMGMTLGLLGGGGSILAVPILRYVVGFEAKQAIALSLSVVGITSAIGAFRYWRGGLARVPVAAAFGLVSMAGSFGGAKAAQFLTGQTQLLIFAVLMLAASVSMWSDRRAEGTPEGSPIHYGWNEMPLAGAAGLGVGLLTGLVGIGGGFMIVPVLVVLLRLPMREAAGTSLIVIAMNAVAGVLGYVGHVEMPWAFLAGFTSVAVGGILIGTALARKIPARILRRAFALFVLAMALTILYYNRGAITGLAAVPTGVPQGFTILEG